MVRAWIILFGLGFLGLWLNYFAGPQPGMDGAWLAWLDVALGAISLVIAGMLQRSTSRLERVAAPMILGVLALAACLFGLRAIGSSELVWGNLVLAVCFFILVVGAAAQQVKTVVRRPNTPAIKEEAPRAMEPAPGPDADELWETYGPRNLGGYEYMQRGGYLEREIPAADGRFWGVGPKGYLQSDVLIAEEISEKMATAPEFDASGIEISVRYGDVTLRGQVAEESSVARVKQICRSVPGAREVRSKLRIVAKAA